MSKKLQASNNPDKYALVDDDVFETIKEMRLKFCINNYGYFCSTSWIKLPGMNKKKYLYLHRFVWIIKTGIEPTSEIDHIDINPLNNQFSNLRLANRKQQQQNKRKLKNNTSGYIGVCHHHCINKYGNGYDYWIAQIHNPDGKNEQKSFPYTENGKQHAAMWRDKKVREYYGDFHGELNFPSHDN